MNNDMRGTTTQNTEAMTQNRKAQESAMHKPETTERPKSTARDMTQGSILGALIAFSIPLLIGNLFQQLYNTVDSIVVGNFVGSDALGAVTAVGPITTTLIALFSGMATGAGVVVSQCFGARDKVGLRKAEHTAIVMTVILGIVMTVLGYVFTPAMLRLMGMPESVFPHAQTYLHIYSLSLLGLVLYNLGAGILRAIGDSKRPLYLLILTSILNIVLDLVFVVTFHWGVAGVAIATAIAQFVSAAIIFAILFMSKEEYSISLREMRIDTRMMQRVVMIGLPTGLQMAIISFSNVFVQAYINSFGAAAIAGWGIYARTDAFAMLPLQSLGMAITTFVGQNAGAGNAKRIHQGVSTGLKMGVTIMLVLSGLIVLSAPIITTLFSKDPSVLQYGVLFIRVNSIFDFVAVMNQVHAGTLRGIGLAQMPMIIMIFSFVVFRQTYLAIATHLTTSIYPVAVAYPAGWLVCSIIMALYFRFSGWQRKLDELEKSREFSETTES